MSACSLPPEELEIRLREWLELARASLVRGEFVFDGVAADELERLVALERACCPSLPLRLEQRGHETVVFVENR